MIGWSLLKCGLLFGSLFAVGMAVSWKFHTMEPQFEGQKKMHDEFKRDVVDQLLTPTDIKQWCKTNLTSPYGMVKG